jgi:signal transduction histidine kinase
MPGPGAPRGGPLPAELARLLHDLRGPLNSAVMHLEVVRRVLADDRAAAESLDTALGQLDRLAELLPTAFDVLRLELSGRARVDLHAVAETVVARHPGAPVRVAPGPWPSVMGDAPLLVLAVDELVTNALEATAGEAACEVSAATEGDTAVLAVRDRGPGLRSTNPRLVIRLGQSSKPGHRGTGLVIVERIARLHGGSVAFASSAAGATICLRLPAA